MTSLTRDGSPACAVPGRHPEPGFKIGRLPGPSGASAWGRTPVRIWRGNLATRALVQRTYGRIEHRRGLKQQANGDAVPRSTRPGPALEQLFLASKRLVDRRLHRLDSTPRGLTVNRGARGRQHGGRAAA